MSRACYEIPPDFWGLSLAEVKKAVKGFARVTNEDYEYNGMTEGFDLKNVGKWKITAPSLKKLKQALFWIGDLRRKKKLEEK